MKLKTIFLFVTLYFLLFIFGKINATTYYISYSGDDGANGKTPGTAWKTIEKIESIVLQPGDSVLFHAGDTWRDEWYITGEGKKGNLIYVGRYGEGKNPLFLGSEQALDWTETNVSNVWQSATPLTNTSEEYYAGRLFFIIDNDSVIYGDYKTYSNLSELTQEFDYSVNGSTHYVYSTIDPDVAYDFIEVNQRERVICLDNYQSYFEFNGIDIMFGRRSGFWSGYPEPRGATDLIFRNCFIGYTGAKGSGSAYGLACFHSNTLIENCTFTDNGRRAISINTYTDNPGGRRIENIIIRNNKFYRGHHTTALDLSTMNREGDTVMNVYFYNNYIDDHKIDTTADYRTSNQIFTQAGIGSSLMTNIYIVGNVFVQATARNIQLENGVKFYLWNNSFIGHNFNVMRGSPYGNVGCGGADTMEYCNNIGYCNLPDNDWENNILHDFRSDTYFSKRDNNLYFTENPKRDRNFTSVDEDGGHYYYPTYEWGEYRTDFPEYDQNSPVPQNPGFYDYDHFDFTLTDSSIARNSGAVLPYVIVKDPFGVPDTINKFDINGTFRSRTSPSIGAYEYTDGSGNPTLDKFSVVISPNPAKEFIKIKLIGPPPSNSFYVQIISLNGSIIYKSQKNIDIDYLEIPVESNFPNGIYALELIFGNSTSVLKKIIIFK